MPYLPYIFNDPYNNKTTTFKYDNNNHNKLTPMPLNDPKIIYSINSTIWMSIMLKIPLILCFQITLKSMIP